MNQLIQRVVANYKKIQKPDEKTNSTQLLNLSYPSCILGGAHEGELLSIVCLEEKCKDSQLLCCCICQEDIHQGHNTKPLKVLLCEHEQQIKEKQHTQSKPLDKEQLYKKINEAQLKSKKHMEQLRSLIMTNFNMFDDALEQYFEQLRRQIKQREVSVTDQQIYIDKVCSSQQDIGKLAAAIRELIEQVQIDDTSMRELSADEINKLVDTSTKDNQNQLQQFDKSLNAILNNQIETLFSKAQVNIFKLPQQHFAFLNDTKHPNIDIVSPLQVKSTSAASGGYKFAVISPGLDTTQQTAFGFKVLNVHSSNWIAVGMCQLQVVQQKQYGFAFQSIGHGGYLVSSNGGSWSNTTANQNNVVKAFKFQKGDSINCNFDPILGTLTFSKVKANSTYKLDIPKSDKPYYPCVLFYYAGDEVEFLPPDKVLK